MQPKNKIVSCITFLPLSVGTAFFSVETRFLKSNLFCYENKTNCKKCKNYYASGNQEYILLKVHTQDTANNNAGKTQLAQVKQ